MGYEDPALEGENITFTCNTGLTLDGPNSSTCMGNGEWEPDPRAASCTSVATGVPTTGASISRNNIVPQIVIYHIWTI